MEKNNRMPPAPPSPEMYERRAYDYLADRITHLEGTIDGLPSAFEEAFRRVLKDEQVLTGFWRRGYDELSEHWQKEASQWIGKRILTSIGAALVAAGLWLLFKFGMKP